MTFRELMTGDHRHCDDCFVAVEAALGRDDWNGAAQAFAFYERAMLAHFSAEESLLFPEFEARTGMRMGPTQVMRNEHAQMRELIEAAAATLREHDAVDYSGYAETLLIMMQQHNMKEENILYPMCDQHLAGQLPQLLSQLETELAEQ